MLEEASQKSRAGLGHAMIAPNVGRDPNGGLYSYANGKLLYLVVNNRQPERKE